MKVGEASITPSTSLWRSGGRSGDFAPGPGCSEAKHRPATPVCWSCYYVMNPTIFSFRSPWLRQVSHARMQPMFHWSVAILCVIQDFKSFIYYELGLMPLYTKSISVSKPCSWSPQNVCHTGTLPQKAPLNWNCVQLFAHIIHKQINQIKSIKCG